MKQAILIASIFALGLSVASCGQQKQAPAETAPQVQSVDVWTSTLPQVAIQSTPEGVVTIAAVSRPSYQAQSAIETAGASTLLLSYDITMQGGPAFLGVLSEDRNTWLANYRLLPGARNQNQAEVAITGDQVFVVLQTTRDTSPNAVFTVHNVEYSLR